MTEYMTDRDRLIELVDKAKEEYAGDVTDHTETDYIAETLLNNGVIVPPVEVGQTVWYIKGGYYNSVNKKPCEIKVTEINKKWHGKTLDWGFIANGTRYRFSSIGKTVFLTKEEAEEKLKELGK